MDTQSRPTLRPPKKRRDGLKEQAKQRDFTIGFMDVHMPVMNGVQALVAIKRLRPRMKMVMMDSYPDALIEEARREGAISCIQKPFEIRQVIEIMEEFVEQAQTF